MKKISTLLLTSITLITNAQSIQNSESLASFFQNLKREDKVTRILFIGDSHTQAGNITDYLREKFQTRYGNAGRGLLFPYPIGNTNGANDFTASSSTRWEVFRLVHDQDHYPQMGAAGFVIANRSAALIEIELKKDTFNQVTIFSDPKMEGKEITFFSSTRSLQDFVRKSTQRVSYQIKNGDTYPELASMFNTTTTRLKALNGASVMQPKPGTWIKADEVSVHYDANFEKTLHPLLTTTFKPEMTEVKLPELSSKLIIKSAAEHNNFYGFYFTNGQKKGVIFNSVGVNGATYADFLKYPMQFRQLKSLEPDLVIIALGTNEGVSRISQDDFKKNATELITLWQSINTHLPILLITPTDNTMNPTKTEQVAQWIVDIAKEKKIGYIHLYEEMGGKGYFKKALSGNLAHKDGVHLLPSGYEQQAQVIWKAFEKNLEE